MSSALVCVCREGGECWYHTALVPNDAFKQSEVHMMIHTICVKLQDLVNATPKFEDLNLKFKTRSH